MPEHNLIQRPDLIHRLQQFFGIRQAHVVPTLGSVVQPVVIVGDINAEMRSHVRDVGLTTAPQLFGVAVVLFSAPGFFATFRLFNPPDSKTVFRIRGIDISTVDVNPWDLRIERNAVELGPGGLTVPIALDTGFPFTATGFGSRASFTIQNAATMGGGQRWFDGNSARDAHLVDDFLPVLFPGTACYYVSQSAAASNQYASFRWTEEAQAL